MEFTPFQKRAAAWTAIAVLVLLALWRLGPVLTPFVVAAVLAYALTPLVNRLDRLGRGKVPRALAVLSAGSALGERDLAARGADADRVAACVVA